MKNKRVKVVVIDSGISNNLRVKSPISFKINLALNGMNDNCEDQHGHGTALVGMLSDFCEEFIELILIKVLDGQCQSTSKQLLRALQIAISLDPDIINMSLGTHNLSFRRNLENEIKYAVLKDILVVTTTGNESADMPFILDDTIKVLTSSHILNDAMYYKSNIFYTTASPHIVPWKNGELIFTNRNSFSTPYFIRDFLYFRRIWNKDDLNNYLLLEKMKESLTVPRNFWETVEVENSVSDNILEIVKECIMISNRSFNVNDNLFKQGIKQMECITLIERIIQEIQEDIPITFFNIYDFEYADTIAEKIGKVKSLIKRSIYEQMFKSFE